MAPTQHIDFLIVDDFSMVGFLCALSAFRIANDVSGHEVYKIRIVAEKATSVTASIGITVVPDAVFDAADRPDIVFVCAGQDPKTKYSNAIGSWLRRVARHGTVLATISTGADLLARAGLLSGYRCTIYWEQAPAFAEEFPDIELTDQIFEIDRTRLTCGGATSSIDLCVTLIEWHLGRQVAAAVSAAFLLDRVRDSGDLQKHAPSVGAVAIPKRLARAITLMESNIEEPLKIEAIAAHLTLGERHLRRLFQDTLSVSPKDYYLLLRLARARMLISQTPLPLQEIAISCGFATASSFASAFRRKYGLSPRQDRMAQR